MEKKYGPRKDYGKPAEGWFKKLRSPQREIALALRKLILGAAPGIDETIKWGNPSYSKNGSVAGIMAAKAHVSLFLPHGPRLKDPKGRLEGSGKMMRSIKIRDVKEIPASDVKRWVKEGIALHGRKGGGKVIPSGWRYPFTGKTPTAEAQRRRDGPQDFAAVPGSVTASSQARGPSQSGPAGAVAAMPPPWGRTRRALTASSASRRLCGEGPSW